MSGSLGEVWHLIDLSPKDRFAQINAFWVNKAKEAFLTQTSDQIR